VASWADKGILNHGMPVIKKKNGSQTVIVPAARSNHFSKPGRPQSAKSLRFVSIMRFDKWAEPIEPPYPDLE
ncbi:MAG: hypothetical protein JJ992_27405, partial [Planctomycetes bacterium]|nr:hypothetical protein [Planctomycetota bacterium]